MSVILAYAVFILMVAAPFMVMLAVILAIAYGFVALLLGLITAKPVRVLIGALVLAVGVGSGLTLFHWTATKPPQGDTSSAHALVHGAWKQTRLRFVALKWMMDGTFERLNEQKRQQDG